MSNENNDNKEVKLDIETSNSEFNDLLSEFDKLTRKQQRAFIAWFSGGKTLITRYDSKKFPGVNFGKAECEWVDFYEVWLNVFPNLDWIKVDIERTGTAKGMIGTPKFTEYKLFVTDKGLSVRDAYWQRVHSR